MPEVNETIGIVFATPQEAGPFAARLKRTGARITPLLGFSFPVFQVPVGERRLLWCSCGIGRPAANRAAQELVSRGGANWLVSAGVSGGLQPGMTLGQVLQANVIRNETGQEWKTDGTEEGQTWRFLCSAQILTTAAKKAEAGRKFSVDAVDMESAGVAEVAEAEHLPFSCIRAISDTVEDGLPLDFTPFINHAGQLLLGRLLFAIVRKPRLIPGLIRLGQNTSQASRNLADVLVARFGAAF